MTRRILCITDPATHPPTDSTVELYARLSADARVRLFHCNPAYISSQKPARVCSVPKAVEFPVFLQLDSHTHVEIPWEQFDLVIHRADEPFPESYMDNLVALANRARFAISPVGMAAAIGREFARSIAGEYLPDWIATRNIDEAAQFIEHHQVVVAKKERSYGGKGVFKIQLAGTQWQIESAHTGLCAYPSLSTLLQALFAIDPLPFEFVRFLKNVTEGDKRVLVLDGKVLGAYLRRSAEGGWINNGTLGGTEVLDTIESHERAVIEATWQRYHAIGLPILGYDFLRDDCGTSILSEINAGNVGGFSRLEKLGGSPALSQLIDWFIDRASASGADFTGAS